MLDNILTIHGESGLFKLLSRSKSMLIVESLKDGKRMPVSSEKKVVSLGDIAVYTNAKEEPLENIFVAIKSAGEGAPLPIDPKSDAQTLRMWFASVLPDFDKDRVYPTDIKKIILWYNLLVEKGFSDFKTKEDAAEIESKD